MTTTADGAERSEGLTARAERLAFLVDADSYFSRLAETFERARRSIYIVGWDVHSRVRLRRDPTDDSERYALASLLNRLARRRRRLRVHILLWDFSTLFTTAREPFPSLTLGWKTHRRVRFGLDGEHPFGACHHQKLVVVDDRVAFVGGIDLTRERWDTREHGPRDSRRVDPDGRPYRPFHDVEVALGGTAARRVGDLVRERWRRATGEALEPVDARSDPWPASLSAELTNVELTLARTEPGYAGRPERREIESLYCEAIASATRCVYIENQYFTSATVGDAIETSLRRERGPHFIIVNPLQTEDWLEQSTMGVLRSRLLERLRTADRHDRLHVYYPRRSDLDEPIHVHSKLCIVDDHWVTVGSANLSNRSMGLDTECNVALAANGDPAVQRVVRRLRHRLLAEHLGIAPEAIGESGSEGGSLVGLIESRRGSRRCLEPLEPETPDWLEAIVPEDSLVDPERPIEPGEFLRRFVDPQPAAGRRRGCLPVAGALRRLKER